MFSHLTTRDYGDYVENDDDVERAIDRLTLAGLASSVEREETRCYANQTKVWAIDPDGRRWEIYTVHEDTEERDDVDTTSCTSGGDESTCCVTS